MGVAIISGVVASLQSRDNIHVPKWESHTPGTSTPTADSPDPSLPSFFIATVTRQESAKKLQHTFGLLGGLGSSVQVLVGENLTAVHQSDVVILWCVVHTLRRDFISAEAPPSCKPHQAQAILGHNGMNEALDGKLLISILAGVTISQLTAWVPPTTKVVRAMPNTPCRVRALPCSSSF